jgi:hypothetical protein
MHKLIGAARCRTAGVAAGLILTGGLAGGVLLTPGTAYAAGPAPTITGTSQTPGFHGTTTLTVDVSVSPAPTLPAAVSVSDGYRGCSATLTSGTGSCSIGGLRPGTYTLTATYDGSSTTDQVPVGSTPNPAPTTSAPVFNADSPPTSTDSPSYSYAFHATGSPAPSYALGSGAPSWLSINPSTGQVWGTVPDGVNSFSYSVTAWNNYGSVTTRPFTVFFWHRHVNIQTSLSCTSPVHTGQHGTCTLWVSNSGPSVAPDVTAQISLPWQLRADYCGRYYWFYYGCSISGNTASENLGTLGPWQTKELTVVFTARTGFNLWGRHRGHRFTVWVVGSAASHGYFWFFGQRESYSVAPVTIIPWGMWW